jgi:recombination associated protein RdgC
MLPGFSTTRRDWKASPASCEVARPMPILRGAVTFARYRVEFPQRVDLKRVLTKGLKSHAFEPIPPNGDEARAAGFAELENPESTDFSAGALHYGERALFTWRIDKIQIPGAQLKGELEKWARDFEQEQDRKPSRGEKTAQKNELRDRLRKRAIPVTKTHDLAWNLDTGELQIWSASRKVIDEIVGAVESAFQARVVPQVPGTVASEPAFKDATFKPTPELAGAEAMEAIDGAA